MARRRHNDGLTTAQVSNYLQDPASCPRCGSDDLVFGSIFREGIQQYERLTCMCCNFSWYAVYTLTAIEADEDN